MNKLPKDFTLDKYGIQVRLVEPGDALFVYKMRSNKKLCKYLNPIEGDVEDQKKWLNDYKEREAKGLEYYFIFSVNGIHYGLERIYNISEDSYTHGSLVFCPDSPLGMAVLADIITREIGFDILGIKTNYFEVRKGNINVLNYHLKLNPEFLYETDIDRHYMLDSEVFKKQKRIFIKIFNQKQTNYGQRQN